jgi:hypothetical protein
MVYGQKMKRIVHRCISTVAKTQRPPTAMSDEAGRTQIATEHAEASTVVALGGDDGITPERFLRAASVIRKFWKWVKFHGKLTTQLASSVVSCAVTVQVASQLTWVYLFSFFLLDVLIEFLADLRK